MADPVITIVQARFGSHRLHGKAMRAVLDKPMLWHVLERAKAIGFPVWLATTTLSADDAVAGVGRECGVDVFRGAEDDVVGRMAETAREADAQFVIRVTGDCPLLSYDVAREVFGLFAVTGGIATNDTTCSGWPDGTDVEVMFATDLYDAATHATGSDREHVTPWIRRNRPHTILRLSESWTPVKLSVDTEPDLILVTEVLRRVKDFTWESTRAVLVEHYAAIVEEIIGGIKNRQIRSAARDRRNANRDAHGLFAAAERLQASVGKLGVIKPREATA